MAIETRSLSPDPTSTCISVAIGQILPSPRLRGLRSLPSGSPSAGGCSGCGEGLVSPPAPRPTGAGRRYGAAGRNLGQRCGARWAPLGKSELSRAPSIASYGVEDSSMRVSSQSNSATTLFGMLLRGTKTGSRIQPVGTGTFGILSWRQCWCWRCGP